MKALRILALAALLVLAACVDGSPVGPMDCGEPVADSVAMTKPATGDTTFVAMTLTVCIY